MLVSCTKPLARKEEFAMRRDSWQNKFTSPSVVALSPDDDEDEDPDTIVIRPKR
ncbi:hypothetical protein KSX_16570 [Ktedonospora formicarum]|uniref:Uncharacterized protein n=1 Tax=Ktedonospora formicarum TaxID=2778364 RepID=A0A8J3I235_9CHLR|nr:hypothetical protein KSX_16570 [Ktedonospora formicarum]